MELSKNDFQNFSNNF